ncbi:MAG: gamma-glutamylcyclotransferase [Deltaproteobacteria bacterium]|nr:gamma-glutamylcyclotransferase [Deltaproteobacteria bacterium]
MQQSDASVVFVVFVYGTLRRGEGNHGLLATAEFLGKARTAPDFLLFDLGAYPAVVVQPDGQGTAIVGELYAVDGTTLAQLDALEEHPDYYVRREIELPGGPRAWIYVLDAAEVALARPIHCGDWRAQR